MSELNKFYLEYGKFIIHFENINFQMCYIIRKICTNNNMFGDEDKRIDILLEGITANPLLSKFRSILITTDIFENPDIKKLIDNFIKNFTKAIETRNFIAHGTFFAGDALGNINNFEVRKPKLGSKGYQQNVNTISIDALKKLNFDMQKLENFIGYFNRYLSKNSPENFKNKIYDEMRSNLEDVNLTLDIINKSIEY